MSTTPDLLPADAPAPRLCHLVKIASFEGYGFNLHAEKSKPGQFIGKVDPHSPAELAGMLEGDRIVEVNGVNIANENHKQVVERIKSVPDETKLLVVDSGADAWYKERKIVPRGTQDNVRYIRTPTDGGVPHQPNGHHHEEIAAANGDVVQKDSEPVELPPDAPKPRLCQMKKWEDFEGYGFNLHAEKDKLGQYVGKIDEGSPAEYAGLREGDRIVEVNGVNILSETHRQIVERIKKVPNETNLLVVSLEAEKWYRDRKIPVTGTQANVLQLKNPALNPATAGARVEEVSEATPAEESEDKDATFADAPTPVLRRQSLSEEDNEKVTQHTTTLTSFVGQRHDEPDAPEDRAPALPSSPPPDETEPEVPDTREEHPKPKETVLEVIKTEVVKTEVVKPEEPKPRPEPLKLPQAKPVEPPRIPTESNGSGSTTTTEAKGSSNGSLNLNMSASEMRQLLAQRKKHDPKKVQMDLKKKYELIEQM